MTRTVRSAWQHKPIVLAVLVAAFAVCALVIVAAGPAGGPERSRVCVSSAAASADANGNVVESKSAVDCDP